MKGLQYPANAHGLCHNVFKRLFLLQENTQKVNTLGSSMGRILLVIENTWNNQMFINALHSPKENRDNTVRLWDSMVKIIRRMCEEVHSEMLHILTQGEIKLLPEACCIVWKSSRCVNRAHLVNWACFYELFLQNANCYPAHLIQ